MVLWLAVKPFLHECILGRGNGSLLQERGVMSTMRLCSRLLHKREVEEELTALLGLLLRLEGSVLVHLAPGVSRGLLTMLENNPEFGKTRPEEWLLPLELVQRMGLEHSGATGETSVLPFPSPSLAQSDQASDYSHSQSPFPYTPGVSLECLAHLVRNGQVFTQVNTPPTLSALEKFLSFRGHAGESTPQWCRRSLDLLLTIQTKLSKLQASVPGGKSRWHPHSEAVFALMISSCKDPNEEVSHHAMRALQRGLMVGGESLSLPRELWGKVMDEYLYPIMEQASAGPSKAKDARLMNASLLFVGVLVPVVAKLAETPKFNQNWRKYLSLLASFTRMEGCGDLSRKVPLLVAALLRRLCQSGSFGGIDKISDSSVLWRATLESGFAFSPNLTPQSLFEMATTDQDGDLSL